MKTLIAMIAVLMASFALAVEPKPSAEPDTLAILLQRMVDAGRILDAAKADETTATIRRQQAQDASAKATAAFWEELHRRFPDPNPTPTPPQPVPPAPIPTPVVTGPLRALFIYDPMKFSQMPVNQQRILTSPVLRAYLDKHCPLESGCVEGACPTTAQPSHSYLFASANTDASNLTPIWQAAFKAIDTQAAPFLYIWDAKTGKRISADAWPASVDDTLVLLRKYGGD